MSKFDLRDISQRLSGSKNADALVSEFLGYLQAVRSDWRATLAFYEVSRDALVSLYAREGHRLMRRDINLPVDRLPPRLVRKFFHPSAFFNGTDRRSLLANLFQNSPFYEPDRTESAGLKELTPLTDWESCLCMPLADQEDLLAMLVLVSPDRGAFGNRVVNDLMPIKSMAALALAQHLHRAARAQRQGEDGGAAAATTAAADFQERIRRLNQHTVELADENQAKAERLQALTREIELLDQDSSEYQQELAQVKDQMQALEEQSAAATEHLNDAYAQLNLTQERMTELERTVGFLKDVFQAMALEHDRHDVSETLVDWFSEHFNIERCSLMVLDPGRDTLRIAAQRGIDPGVAARVRVRLGQGIAGWVAQNRKPLFVRVKSDARVVPYTAQDVYNSDSFIAVPLIHAGQMAGVLNLSNKQSGLPFDELDLDRALLAGSLLAMTLAGQEEARRSAAWA
ncbi:MAG: GAF domain-containing protein [Candidatus Eisenbacteria bacterium]|uniref:GAF domain-containing protein n=1 Tax=Eiseniibacteriota bacterium TaxID=2212470 RepID=A0A538U161_UNCEI|nr:MAG: GAF domain-containing protein [Candidatus Eisenbacteria bacterium]